MGRFRVVSAAVLIPALLIAPTIASATDEILSMEQSVLAPVADEVNEIDWSATPTVEGGASTPAPTPQAAVGWNQMEEARRAARDRAMALRQQTILDETQALPAR